MLLVDCVGGIPVVEKLDRGQDPSFPGEKTSLHPDGFQSSLPPDQLGYFG